MKYILLQGPGYGNPVLFGGCLGHDEVARALGREVISAGFCSLNKPDPWEGEYDVKVWGGSTSLGLKSRGADDELAIRKGLRLP